jgi:hypothetical protein
MLRAGRPILVEEMRFFSPPPLSPRLWGTSSLLYSGYRRLLSMRVKRSRREANYRPPSISEVKNAWNCTSTPPYVFMLCCLVKHRDNFALLYVFNPSHKHSSHICRVWMTTHAVLKIWTPAVPYSFLGKLIWNPTLKERIQPIDQPVNHTTNP